MTKHSKKRSDFGDPVVLFDGVCNFCNGTVRFIIERDPGAHFRFASLQSTKAREQLGLIPLPFAAAANDLSSIVLIQWGHAYFKTDAVLRIARLLSGGWSWLYLLLAVPRPIRDAFYDWFAANRYRWFGKLEECPLPSPEDRARFL